MEGPRQACKNSAYATLIEHLAVALMAVPLHAEVVDGALEALTRVAICADNAGAAVTASSSPVACSILVLWAPHVNAIAGRATRPEGVRVVRRTA